MLTTWKSKLLRTSIMIELIGMKSKEEFSSCNFEKQEICTVKNFNFYGRMLINSLGVESNGI
ncbi:hypothetical protein M1558_00560 [Candidatus Parvarchaeota archaeon]|nr:hypothetical protein [Candidatus Parvarchaeota archaeon]